MGVVQKGPSKGVYRGHVGDIHSWKLTWKPKKGPIKTTVLLKGGHMSFQVSLGECIGFRKYGFKVLVRKRSWGIHVVRWGF